MLELSIVHPEHPGLWAGTIQSHNSPQMACKRKAMMMGHVLVPSCLSGNSTSSTSSVPSIYEIKALIWSQCVERSVLLVFL